jgi:hypothetical protein
MTRRIPCLVQLPGMWSPLEMFNRRALCPLGLGVCDGPERQIRGLSSHVQTVRWSIGICDANALSAVAVAQTSFRPAR